MSRRNRGSPTLKVMKAFIMLTMIAGQALGFLMTSRGPGFLCFPLKNVRLSAKVSRILIQSQSDPPETRRWSNKVEDTEDEVRVAKVEKEKKLKLKLTVFSAGFAIAGLIVQYTAAPEMGFVVQAVGFLSIYAIIELVSLIILFLSVPKGKAGGGSGIFLVVIPIINAMTSFPIMTLFYLCR